MRMRPLAVGLGYIFRSASNAAMRATPSVVFWRASPPERWDDSSVVDARAVARVRSAESRRVDSGSGGVARRRGPRRAHRGCGSRDGPAVAPDAALCGSARGVTVATRNAALGLIAASQVNSEQLPEATCQWAVPAGMHPPIEQQAILLTHGADNKTALAFLEFVGGPEGRAIIRAQGYEVPD